MKRIYLCLLIILGIVSTFGCEEEKQENEMVMEGIVAKVDARKILIYEERKGETLVLSEEEVISKSVQASYFSFDNEISDIEVGDIVKVWYDVMDKSLPGSGHGTKIEVIDN